MTTRPPRPQRHWGEVLLEHLAPHEFSSSRFFQPRFAMSDISEAFRWNGVELRHLVALRSMSEEGSLAGAARSLGYSQSAVSQQLQTLERLVGSRLVERPAGGREVHLTEAEQRVLVLSRRLLPRSWHRRADPLPDRRQRHACPPRGRRARRCPAAAADGRSRADGRHSSRASDEATAAADRPRLAL